MISTLLVKRYDAPQFDKSEILRYMGCKKNSEDVNELVDSCLEEAASKFTYKVCYRQFNTSFGDAFVDLGFAKTTSPALIKNLKDCDSVILFAATVGLEIDRIIAKYGRISPSKALCFQAIGAERIESLCNVFNDEISQEAKAIGLFTRPRFSPGYGDFPLETQKQIFSVLDCSRKIGLSLNESLLMSPSKSVTALIGISALPTECKRNTCENCKKADCTFRRQNK